MVVVTHEMGFAKSRGPCHFMDAGIIQEEGTPEEILMRHKTQEHKIF